MSIPPRPSDASDPAATIAETLNGEPPAKAPAPDATLAGSNAATGEFTLEMPPTLPPPAPAPAAQTLAGATGMFAPESAPHGLPQTFAATGVFEPEGQGGDVPVALQGTVELGSAAGATVDLAATGAFTIPGTEPASPSSAQRKLSQAETEVMATGDFGSPPPSPSGRARNVPFSQRCGRYVLKHFHAKGGMGEIWMAEDPDIGRPVALKRMLSERPDQVHRFRVEAQVTGQLEHPGIVPVHELGVNEAGQTYYAMKFVQGKTLKKVVDEYHAEKAAGRGSTVEEVRLLQLFLSLCQTVAYAHSRGVLHRDLKPENVMLGEFGETILLDWGIAKVVGEPEELPAGDGKSTTFVQLEASEDGTETRAGAIMGTPGYMAPEVAMGQNAEVDFRSDVYLLGATLYEMLTAHQPRTGKNALEMVKKARNEPPARVRTIDPRIPKVLDAICFKAMAHLKRDRYQSAQELAEDVQRYLAGEPVTAYQEDFWERAWRWAKRHRVALRNAAAALVVAIPALAAYGQYRKIQHEHARLALQVATNQERERARQDLKDFRRLVDEASYYSANTDQVAENAPFTDPRMGSETAKKALELAAKWGPSLEQLPIVEERETTARQLNELNRLAAHLEGLEKTRASIALGAVAEDIGNTPSAAPRRIIRVAQEKPAAAAVPAPPVTKPAPARTALDHYFRGEALREQARVHKDVPAARDTWKPDTELMEQAIDEYRKALTIDPEHYWSHYQLGRCYLTLGRLAESIEALGACIALRPDSAWGYSARGFALFRLKRFDEAIADLDRAVALDPASRVSRLNRGAVYLMQKNYPQARADFEAVLEPPAEKQLIQAAYYLGYMHAQLGDNKNALKEFDRVVAENPRMQLVYYWRAQVHFANGDESLGLEDLDRYIANGGPLDRDGWRIHGMHGHLLRSIHGELTQAQRREKWGVSLANLAVGELLQAIKLGGQAWDIFDDLGAMLEHTGRLKEAIPAYSKGLEFNPNNVKLRNKRGWAWVNAGRHKEALADFVAAAKADSEDAEAHTGTGYILALSKQTTEAQREAELALLHGSDEFLVLHNIACIYATLSEGISQRPEAYQEVAVSVLKRAIARWKTAETPLDEIELMKGEPAFRSLRARADFQELIAPAAQDARPRG